MISRCVWMIILIYIYIVHIFQKCMISGRYASFSKPSFSGEIYMVLRTLGDLPTSPCSVPSRRTWTIGSWKTAVTGWFCVFVCCFVGEKNQWMSWMSRCWAALAKSPLVAEKEKRWFCGTTFCFVTVCLRGTFIRTLDCEVRILFKALNMFHWSNGRFTRILPNASQTLTNS